MAASFSLCRICTWIARHSVTSSPMVMTWVMASPSRRIGILRGAEVAHLAALRHLELDLLDGPGLEDAVELGLELAGRMPRQHLEHGAGPRCRSRGMPWVPVSRLRFQTWMR